jgi:quercetin 2,3-dioxygenase
VLTGRGYAGSVNRAISDHQLVVFGGGEHLVLRAADVRNDETNALDVLLLGGLPIRQPIAHYGPFVMNTREEIIQTLEDYRRGRLGVIPADQIAPRRFS